MSINLSKGQGINLKKPTTESVEFDLSNVTFGLGWDINDEKKERNGNYDLDASCVLLKDGKLQDNSDVVAYFSKRHKSGHVWSNGDNLTGEGEGDDEQIVAKLEQLSKDYNKLVFFVTLYNGKSKGQKLGDVNNAFIRAIDAKGKEIARYNISGLAEKRSLIFAEINRTENSWELKTIGDAFDSDSIESITEKFKSSEPTKKKSWF